MKKLILIAFACCSSFMAMSQSRLTKHIEISKDALIQNYASYLPKGENIEVKGFIVSAQISNSLTKDIVTPTGRLTDEQAAMIQEIPLGGKVYFDRIEFENSKGELELYDTLVFELIE